MKLFHDSLNLESMGINNEEAKRKPKMMRLLDACVELDFRNMAPIIETEGGRFDPAFRRARLISELDSSL